MNAHHNVDRDIPERFRGDQEMLVFEHTIRIAGKLHQLIATATGNIGDCQKSDEEIRKEFTRKLFLNGTPLEILKLFRLRGISPGACEYIEDAMHIVAGPTHTGQKVPMQSTLSRERLISLLRHGSGARKRK